MEKNTPNLYLSQNSPTNGRSYVQNHVRTTQATNGTIEKRQLTPTFDRRFTHRGNGGRRVFLFFQKRCAERFTNRICQNSEQFDLR